VTEDGGKVGLNVVPDFSGWGSLFSGGIRGILSTAQQQGGEVGKLLGLGMKQGVELGTVAAGIAIGDFVTSSVRHFESLGTQTLELQHLTGATAQQASQFASVIRLLGGNVDSTSRGLGIMADHLQRQPGLFAQLGVEIAHMKDGNVDLLGTLDNLRKKFQETGDATAADSTAKQLLGRSYQQLLPYLHLTNDQLELFHRIAQSKGEILSQADVDNVREAKIATQELTDSFDTLKNAVGRAGTSLLDEFTKGLNVIGHMFEHPSDIWSGQWISDSAAKAANANQVVAAAEVDAADAAQQNQIAQQNLATSEKELETAAKGVRSAQEALTQSDRAVDQAVRGVAKAVEAEGKAHEQTQRAVQSRTQAQQDLNALLAKGAVDANAVEQAERGVQSASRQVRDATEALSDATQKLRDVQQGATADELTDAHLRLAEATLSVAEARRQAATAHPTLSDPFAAQRARLGVQSAVQAQRKAQDDLTKTQQMGTAADARLTAAQKAVRDASERVTDALQAQDDAQKKLNEAQAGDPEFQKKVADAKQRVADASLAVRDAQQSERDAAQGVRDAQEAVTDAQDREKDATYNLRDAQYSLNDALAKAEQNGLQLGGVIDDLIRKYPELSGILNALAQPVPIHYQAPGASIPIDANYDPRTGKLSLAPGPTGVGAGVPVSGGGRERGGDVYPGYYYRWQEHGQEYFAPKVPGTVTPAGGDGAAAPAPVDYDRLGEAVAAALVQAGRPLVTVGEHVLLAQQNYRRRR
jgi:hypothetical protein